MKKGNFIVFKENSEESDKRSIFTVFDDYGNDSDRFLVQNISSYNEALSLLPTTVILKSYFRDATDEEVAMRLLVPSKNISK